MGESICAVSSGVPAREAELQALQQRCSLLQRTVADWRESLERKQLECETYRRRARQHGDAMEDEEMAGTEQPSESLLALPPGRSGMAMKSVTAGTRGTRADVVALEESCSNSISSPQIT